MKFFNRKPKGLIVFVKNKLISLDSIAPILLELKENHNISYPLHPIQKHLLLYLKQLVMGGNYEHRTCFLNPSLLAMLISL